MAKIPLDQIKQAFGPGKTPSAQDWINFFDSFVHKDSQTAIDAQVVSTEVAAYDASLKQRTLGSNSVTLGDLLKVFANFDPTKVATPIKLLTYDNQPIQQCDPSIAQFNPALQTNPNVPITFTLAGSSGYIVNNISVQRRYLTINGTSFYADVIIGVQYGNNPKVALQ